MSNLVCSKLRVRGLEQSLNFLRSAWKQPTSKPGRRTASTMAQVSPFTATVVGAMRHLYPESLADQSFDNTGLLLESPVAQHGLRKSNSVLLTIDLTRTVAEEAIQNNHSVVVAYHPIIFRGLKAITLADTQQSTLLRLASHGISVYSPHTAVDTVPDGMADWLCDIVTGKVEPGPEGQAFSAKPENIAMPPTSPSETDVTTSEEELGKSQLPNKSPNENTPNHTNGAANSSTDSTPKARPAQRPKASHRTYSKPSYPSQRTSSPIRTANNSTFYPSHIAHRRSVIIPRSGSAIDAANSHHQQTANHQSTPYSATNTGSGRLITFDEPQPLATLITRIANATGLPKGFPVAIPQYKPLETLSIRTVGVCPGSGSSVVRECHTPPDLVFMGEMSHHDALSVIERGGCVITLFHSNSERGYLERVMRRKLEDEIKRRWREVRQEQQLQPEESSQAIKEIFADDSVKVVVSQRDRDPFGIVVLQESQVEGQTL